MFRKNFYTTFIYIALISFAIASCKKEKAPEVDPNTLPVANFFCDAPLYKIIDGNTYAFVTAHDNSAYSNRWKWNRPNSQTDISGGAIEFMTDKDTAVTQVYLATKTEQRFTISLTTYSYVAIGLNPDSTINYQIFESSHPCIREVVVKIPE